MRSHFEKHPVKNFGEIKNYASSVFFNYRYVCITGLSHSLEHSVFPLMSSFDLI